jgi:sulfate adenylyltransferase
MLLTGDGAPTQTYEVLKKETENPKIVWAYLPYAMHMAGPREAIQHMLIRKNYGCTHFIIGRDMAGSKSCLDGELPGWRYALPGRF